MLQMIVIFVLGQLYNTNIKNAKKIEDTKHIEII